MVTVYRSVTLGLTPDELWQRVADIGGISQLLDAVSHSEASGTNRSCVLADGARLEEEILGVDAEHRRVAYRITQAPFALNFHAASMQVHDAQGGRSRLTWITDVTPQAAADAIGALVEGECTRLAEKFP